MTLQQLKYAVTVAECGTISAAAEKLFISQPSLTTAIRELEAEMGVRIFSRTNRGVIVSREGEELLGYARQVLSQAQLMQERFGGDSQGEKRFSVSSQHFHFAVRAFSRLVQNFPGQRYSFHFRETTTYEVLTDVSQLRSEIGVLALNDDKERYLRRMFGRLDLEFTELIRVPAAVYIAKDHPLAGRSRLTPEELAPYPCITFEQGEHNGQFFFEGLSSVAVGSPRWGAFFCVIFHSGGKNKAARIAFPRRFCYNRGVWVEICFLLQIPHRMAAEFGIIPVKAPQKEEILCWN